MAGISFARRVSTRGTFVLGEGKGGRDARRIRKRPSVDSSSRTGFEALEGSAGGLGVV